MKTEYEKCMAGEPFIGGNDPKIVEMILRTRRLLAQFNATDYADTERKQALLREMFGSLGKGVHVDIDFHCEYGKNIFVGDKVIINMNCTFIDNNRIEIGNNVLIAPNVQIIYSHPFYQGERAHGARVDRGAGDMPYICFACQNRGRCVDRRRRYHSARGHYRAEQRHRSRQCGFPFYPGQ